MGQRRMNFGVRWQYDTKGDGFALFITLGDALEFQPTMTSLGPTEVVDLKTREVMFRGKY